MNGQRVVRLLHEITGQEINSAFDIWTYIKTQLDSAHQRLRRKKISSITCLSWSILALFLLLTLGSIGYAKTDVMKRLIHQDPGLRSVEQDNLFHGINLSQTIDDVTVNLQQVYADASRIAVVFTIGSHSNQRYDPYKIVLTDTAGTVYAPMISMGDVDKSYILDLSLPKGSDVYVWVDSFDASSIQDPPNRLFLRLSVELKKFRLFDPFSTDGIIGPFTFDFNTTYYPGNIVEIAQTVESDGLAVTLTQLVITPSGTRAIFCFDPSSTQHKSLAPIAVLDTESGRTNSGETTKIRGAEDEVCYRTVFFPRQNDRPERWSITVGEMVDIESTSSEQTRISGPWVFPFIVP
jgi:hypothetical protein